MMAPARNQPCPCGSGRTYKRCPHAPRPVRRDTFSFSYKGDVTFIPGTPIARRSRGPVRRGERVFVWTGLGFGDSIQYARYVPCLVAAGALVTFAVQPSLQRLFGRLGATLVPMPTGPFDARDFDAITPAMGLPMLLGEVGADPRSLTIPMRTTSVPPPPLAAPWHGPRWPRRAPRVGLCWAGEPFPPGRSVPVEALRPLLAVPAVQFVSLQCGQALPGLPALALQDWADTAGVIQQLDLVVSVDTAVAHLAGSLGVPTWVLLRTRADTRWGGAETTPWYPSVRLFRQPVPGAWGAVLARVATALRTLCDAPAALPPLGAATTT